MTTSTQVPGVYPVALNGRPYLASFEEGAFAEQTIPLQKAQQDTSGLPGEQSLNPDDLWRRSMESWHRGAGQEYRDWEEGDKFRFRSSLGIDPWTEKRLSLLKETEVKLASTATGVRLVVAGSYLYCADGQTLKFTQDVATAGAATWTTVTGTPSADITGLTSDGHRVWIAFGSSGIYYTTAGAATASQFSTTAATAIDYVKGRLMTGTGSSIYNVTHASAESPTFRSVSYNADAGAATSKSVARPAGLLEGDLMVLIVATEGAASPISATGFEVPLPANAATQPSYVMMNTHHVYIKIATAADVATDTFTVTMPASTDFSIALASYYAANAGIIVDIASATGTGTSTSPSASAITTSFINDTVLWVGQAMGTATWTPPAGFTERLDAQMTSGPTIHLSDKVQAAPGSTGAMTGTLSASQDWYATAIALRASGISDPLFSHGSSGFTWVGFAEGQGDIYAAGYVGDKSLIYRTQIRADGTALDAPVVAGSLPDGEIVRGIYGYLGILFIGTDSGVRMAISDANGDLTIGARIDTPSPVRCFEGQEHFVWFGLEDFDISRWGSGTYDGLGRLDLTAQTDTLVPAWASDIMAAASTSTTESVQSIVTFQDRRVFSIASSNALSRGVYGEKANKVASGYLDSGLITFDLADTKVATYLDLRHKSLTGTIDVYVSTDEGAFSSIGSSSTPSSIRPATDPLPVGPTRGDVHEIRLNLNRVNGSDTVGPVATRAILRAEPAPARGRVYRVRLILEELLDINGTDTPCDIAAERAAIRALFDSQTLIDFQEGGRTEQVFIKDFSFESTKMNQAGTTVAGNLDVILKVPGS